MENVLAVLLGFMLGVCCAAAVFWYAVRTGDTTRWSSLAKVSELGAEVGIGPPVPFLARALARPRARSGGESTPDAKHPHRRSASCPCSRRAPLRRMRSAS